MNAIVGGRIINDESSNFKRSQSQPQLKLHGGSELTRQQKEERIRTSHKLMDVFC